MTIFRLFLYQNARRGVLSWIESRHHYRICWSQMESSCV